MLHWSGVLVPSAVSESFKQFGVHLPVPGGEVLRGLLDIGPLLATAIPLGVYNFIEGMNNVESADIIASWTLATVFAEAGQAARRGHVLVVHSLLLLRKGGNIVLTDEIESRK